MSDLIRRVEDSIFQKALLPRGQNVLVGVSGGLDSMVLLHVLHHLSQEYGWHLRAAHFNHQLRGRSSDADERLVRRTAERLGVPFVAGRADVKRFAGQKRLSIEMAARQLRHDFLARTARRKKAAIALGHHADDQVELFFVRLLRGAGSEGLSGMKWSSLSPSDPDVRLVRPLLDRTKKELEQFAAQEKIPFREDATNVSLDFLRNRCRHELLPLLQKHYQPALLKTTLRLMEMLEAESEFVAESAKAWLKNRHRKERPDATPKRAGTPALRRFAELPLAVQRRAVQLQLFGLGLKADFDLVEHLRSHPDAPLTLGPRHTVWRDAAGTVHIRTIEATPQFNAARLALKLNGTRGTASFGRLRIRWQIEPPPEKWPGRPTPSRTDAMGGQEWFDADKVGATIALRHWQPGDRFQPIGMQRSVKLQDLFSDRKIPRAQRHQLAIAIASSGETFWVEGIRISERFKLDKRTIRCLYWCWECQ